MNNNLLQNPLYEEQATMLRTIAHPVRLRILKILIEKGPTNVSSIYQEIGLPQSTISQHLSKMKSSNSVSCNRKGLEVFYKVTDENVIKIIDIIK